MKLLFARSHWPGSYAIRALTFSQWSHVAPIADDGTSVEAVFPRVRVATAGGIIDAHSAFAIAHVECPNEAAAWRFLDQQVGKLYDLGALVALPFQRRDWESPSRYFCSELVAAALNAGGRDLFRDFSRVTPEMLWQIARPM